MGHQFKLFPSWQRPKAKIPISAEQIEKAKALYESGDQKGAVTVMRQLREGLEKFEKRMGR